MPETFAETHAGLHVNWLLQLPNKNSVSNIQNNNSKLPKDINVYPYQYTTSHLYRESHSACCFSELRILATNFITVDSFWTSQHTYMRVASIVEHNSCCIERASLYLTENKLHLHYKDRRVNSFSGNDNCYAESPIIPTNTSRG